MKQQAHKIVVVKDSADRQSFLRHLLVREPGFLLSAEVEGAMKGPTAIKAINPDLVILETVALEADCSRWIRSLVRSSPKLKLVVVSSMDSASYANRLLRAGAHGYILEKEEPGELLQALRDVMNGHLYVSEEVLSAPVRPPLGWAGRVRRVRPRGQGYRPFFPRLTNHRSSPTSPGRNSVIFLAAAGKDRLKLPTQLAS